MQITGTLRRAAVFSFFLAAAAFAHGEKLSTWEKLGLYDPVAIMLWAAAVSGIFIAGSVYYRKEMGAQAKKVAFILIAVPVLIATLYLSASTVYLNLNSATGGPVHWHADYEIWACGERHELVDPSGFDNKVGTPSVHEHNDNRIHVEGVLLEMHEASLGGYFESVGGELTPESLSMPTNEGRMEWRNGDLCNDSPGRWRVFVNGKPVENAAEHVIAPYPTVPPGDRIKFVFTEKSLDRINAELGESP